MSDLKFANNASGTLLYAITDSELTLQLESSDGADFPEIPLAEDHYYATLVEVTGGKETDWEIIKVNYRFGDLIGVERGQEGTTARAWGAGTLVSLRLTAAQVAAFEEAREWGDHSGLYLPIGGGTVAGTVKALRFRETVVAIADTTDIDLDTGNVFHAAPASNKTYTFSNAPAAGTAASFTFEVTPSAALSITWPASVKWPDGAAPAAPSSGDTNIFTFFTRDGGTTWYGFVAGESMS